MCVLPGTADIKYGTTRTLALFAARRSSFSNQIRARIYSTLVVYTLCTFDYFIRGGNDGVVKFLVVYWLGV